MQTPFKLWWWRRRGFPAISEALALFSFTGRLHDQGIPGLWVQEDGPDLITDPWDSACSSNSDHLIQAIGGDRGRLTSSTSWQKNIKEGRALPDRGRNSKQSTMRRSDELWNARRMIGHRPAAATYEERSARDVFVEMLRLNMKHMGVIWLGLA